MSEVTQTPPASPASEPKADLANGKEQPVGSTVPVKEKEPVEAAKEKPSTGSDAEDAAETAADAVVFPRWSEVFMAVLIMGAGAFGGWFVGAVPLNGLSQGNLLWWQRLLVGGVAAGVMVYYVAKSDRRRFWHCLFFAFLCGMIGQPLIINTINGLLPGSASAIATSTEALQQSSNAVAVAVGQQSATQTTAGLQQVEASAQKLMGAAKTAKNPDEKAKATEALSATLTQLGDSLPSTPEEARADMIKTMTNLATSAYMNQDQSGAPHL